MIEIGWDTKASAPEPMHPTITPEGLSAKADLPSRAGKAMETHIPLSEC